MAALHCALALLVFLVASTSSQEAEHGPVVDVLLANPVSKSQEELHPLDKGADLIGEDLARKKKKNSTVGQDVLTAVIDGLSGESEDAAFGSEIRKELGYLIQAVTNFGQQAATEYENEGSRKNRSLVAVGDGRGRKHQVRRLLIRYLVLLKVFVVGIILPGAVLLSLVQSWKAVTASLLALMLASVVGLRGLASTAGKAQAEAFHGSHYWRRGSPDHPEDDRFAFGTYHP